MEQSKQVCNRELAENMKAQGFKQKSQFYWVKGLEVSEYPNGDEYESWFQKGTVELINKEQAEHVKYVIKECCEDGEEVELYSAYTVAELGEMLPNRIRGARYLYITCGDDGWVVFYNNTFELMREDCLLPEMTADTMADAMAQMLIWMAEQNLINPKTIKI